MAIYHLSIKMGGKTGGKSAVASAAYRSGEELTRERDNTIKNYSRKQGVVHSEILLPENAPERFRDREKLWNDVEKTETAADAQYYREFEIALPRELTRQQQIEAAREFCRELNRQGMITDLNIHDKQDGNPHAHIMCPTRQLDAAGNWSKIKDSKKVYANDTDKNGKAIYNPEKSTAVENRIAVLDPETGQQKIGARGRKEWVRVKVDANPWNDRSAAEGWRESWERVCNHALERAGRAERVDRRSHRARGIKFQPTIHEGVTARAIERKRPGTSRRVSYNNKIKGINAEIRSIDKEARQISLTKQHGAAMKAPGKAAGAVSGAAGKVASAPLKGAAALNDLLKKGQIPTPKASAAPVKEDNLPWSALTRSAQLEKMADHRFDEDWGDDEGESLKGNVSYIAPEEKQERKKKDDGDQQQEKQQQRKAEPEKRKTERSNNNGSERKQTANNRGTGERISQPRAGAVRRSWGSNIEAFGQRTFVSDVSVFGMDAKKTGVNMFLSHNALDHVDVELTGGLRDNALQRENAASIKIEKPQEVEWAEESVERIGREEKAAWDKYMKAHKAAVKAEEAAKNATEADLEKCQDAARAAKEVEAAAQKQYKEFNLESGSELRRRLDGLEKLEEKKLEEYWKEIEKLEAAARAKAEADFIEKSPLKPKLDKLEAAESEAWGKYDAAKAATAKAQKGLDALIKAEPKQNAISKLFGESADHKAWARKMAAAEKNLAGAKTAEGAAGKAWTKANGAANSVRGELQAGAKAAGAKAAAQVKGAGLQGAAGMAANAIITVIQTTITIVRTCLKVMDEHNKVMQEIVSSQQQAQQKVMVRSLY